MFTSFPSNQLSKASVLNVRYICHRSANVSWLPRVHQGSPAAGPDTVSLSYWFQAEKLEEVRG